RQSREVLWRVRPRGPRARRYVATYRRAVLNDDSNMCASCQIRHHQVKSAAGAERVGRDLGHRTTLWTLQAKTAKTVVAAITTTINAYRKRFIGKVPHTSRIDPDRSNALDTTSAPALRDDLGDRELEDVGRAGGLQLGDQTVDAALVYHRLDREPPFSERRDGGRLHRGHHGEHGVELALGDVQLDEDPAFRLDRAPEQGHDVIHGRALRGVGGGVLVRDQHGVRCEQGLDDLQTVGSQR